jgi:transposase
MRRKFDKDFKLNVIYELNAGKSIAQLSREHDIHANLIYCWKKIFDKHGEESFLGNGKTYKTEARIAELERKIGQLTLENDLLKKAIRVQQEMSVKKKGNKEYLN